MNAEAPTGAWLFRYRSFLPVPLALVLVLVDKGALKGPLVSVAGVLLVLTGQGLRLWAVRHIGTISRTRTTRYGPLMTRGPYGMVRNPLYVGNWFLWTGFAVWSGLLWMLPIAWILFALQYRAIARWESGFIGGIYGTAYEDYARQVRAWIPRWPVRITGTAAPLHPWREVLFSERGTLMAAGLMSFLMILKRTTF